MKKIILVVSLLVSSFIFAQSFQATDIKDYTIDLPENWTVSEENQQTVFMLLSPIEGDNDQFRENCNLVTEEIPAQTTVKKYILQSITGLKNYATKFKIIKRTENTVHYDAVFSNISVRQIQFYYVVDTKGYIVTCSSNAKNYKRFEKIFMQVGQSLKIKS